MGRTGLQLYTASRHAYNGLARQAAEQHSSRDGPKIKIAQIWLMRVGRGGLWPQFDIIHKLRPSWEAYLNVRAYGEFAEQNRTSGFTMFVTHVISHKAEVRTAGVE